MTNDSQQTIGAAVQRRLDEHTVAEYQRIAGQMDGVIPAPLMVERAVKRLIAAEEEGCRKLQRDSASR